MQGLEVALRELRYARGFAFVQDVSYVGFLDRVLQGELRLRAAGLNEEIMQFCEEAGIPCVQYLATLPYYADQDGWEKKHFGPAKCARFVARKEKYDHMAILYRGREFSCPRWLDCKSY
jgi:hypothetical protein